MTTPPLLEVPNRLFGWSMTDLTLYGAQPTNGLGYVNAAIAPAGDLPRFEASEPAAPPSTSDSAAVSGVSLDEAIGSPLEGPPIGTSSALPPSPLPLSVPTSFSAPDPTPVAVGSGAAVVTPLPHFAIQPGGALPAVDEALGSIAGGLASGGSTVSHSLASLDGVGTGALHGALMDGVGPLAGAVVAPLLAGGVAEIATPAAETVGAALALADAVVLPVLDTGASVLSDTAVTLGTVTSPVADLVSQTVDDLGPLAAQGGELAGQVLAPAANIAAPLLEDTAGLASPALGAVSGIAASVGEAAASITAPVAPAVVGIAAPLSSAIEPVGGVTAPLVEGSAHAAGGETIGAIADAALTVAAPTAASTTPLVDAVTPHGVGESVADTASPSLDVAELGGSDPAAGIDTLVGMVSSGDAFELAGPSTGDVVLSTGPSVMDTLADEIAGSGSLLGDAAHHDGGESAFDHHDHLVGL